MFSQSCFAMDCSTHNAYYFHLATPEDVQKLQKKPDCISRPEESLSHLTTLQKVTLSQCLMRHPHSVFSGPVRYTFEELEAMSTETLQQMYEARKCFVDRQEEQEVKYLQEIIDFESADLYPSVYDAMMRTSAMRSAAMTLSFNEMYDMLYIIIKRGHPCVILPDRPNMV